MAVGERPTSSECHHYASLPVEVRWPSILKGGGGEKGGRGEEKGGGRGKEEG